MGRTSGGAGRAGRGGGHGIKFSTDTFGSALYSQEKGRRRELLLTVPRRTSGAHRTAAEGFMKRTATRAQRARTEGRAITLLRRADRVLSKIENAQVFNEPVPKLPW